MAQKEKLCIVCDQPGIKYKITLTDLDANILDTAEVCSKACLKLVGEFLLPGGD